MDTSSNSDAETNPLDSQVRDADMVDSRAILRKLRLFKQVRWALVISIAVVAAIVGGLTILKMDSEKLEPEARKPVESQAAWASTDTDRDGIEDALEVRGWRTQTGEQHRTDPLKPDSDGDGLKDGGEAGDVVSGAEFERVYAGISNPSKQDSDDDGLDDNAEVLGWSMQSGTEIYTEPLNSDTDGDGLLDGEEAGSKVEKSTDITFVGFSDPTLLDTDGDGLDDAQEADASVDAFIADTDGDGLTDSYEVNMIGTDPTVADSDGDGFDDQFEDLSREERGIDPLFLDVETSAWDYAGEFAQGAVAGEVTPGDSVAWLSGNLAVGGLSFVPGIGWIVGGVADLRDTIASLFHADWVGAGFSALGLIPYVGDGASIPAKVGAFVVKHPELAAAVGGLIIAINKVPTEIKIAASRKIWKEWDYLVANGASEKELLRLQKSGKVNLDRLGEATRRDGHVAGPAAPYMASGPDGEKHLEKMLQKEADSVSTQITVSTGGCVEVCNGVARRFDVVADGTAYESKVGYTSLTKTVKRQIESDAYLIKNGAIQNSQWHFYSSDITNQLGPTKPLLDYLDSKGISYTIHLPSKK